MQRLPLLLGIEAGHPGRRVVGAELLADPAVAGAGDVAGRQVDQAAMTGPAEELQDIHRRIHVGRQRIPQVGLKSVSPELLMMRSSLARRRAPSSGLSPSPGCETSPSTTSTLSFRNAGKAAPYRS